MSLDRASRFVVAWATGPREAALAEQVVRQTRQRTAQRAGVPWVSDGWAPYAAAVDAVYRDATPAGVPPPAGIRAWQVLRRTAGTALTQACKQRRGRRLVRVDVRATIGAAAAQPYPVHVERLNGGLRDRLAGLTRKTHAFAKEPALWEAVVMLALVEHNWCRPHPALRLPAPADAHPRRYLQRTPAMAQGLTDHPWSLVELLTHPVYPKQRE